ncbi:MAG: cupin domain-containing protein [Rhodospirillaceae bacterium]|jgi:dTDP-4-dehydrorhamnose 3,5-epimerase-like enzyme
MTIRPPSDAEQKQWPTSVIVPIDEKFTDERGEIIPLSDLTMDSAVMISSKKGTVRANHYHQTDWHLCYVISGSIDYYHRPHGSTDDPDHVHVKTGELFFTPPLVDHAMVFPEDTVFLTLGRNPRDQETYESDVVRIPPIEPQS